MRKLLVGLVLAALAPGSALACAPKSMVRAVYREVTPGLPAGSFLLTRKTLHRYGNLYLRSAEELDRAQNIHQLIVAHAPNIWFANLVDGSGQHMVDTGPSIDVHAPMFSGPGVSKAVQGLEFGCEAEFVSQYVPKAAGPSAIAGAGGVVHRLSSGAEMVEFHMRGARPVQVSYSQGGKVLQAYRYDDYATGLKFDPTLFVKPAGVKFVESK